MLVQVVLAPIGIGMATNVLFPSLVKTVHVKLRNPDPQALTLNPNPETLTPKS